MRHSSGFDSTRGTAPRLRMASRFAGQTLFARWPVLSVTALLLASACQGEVGDGSGGLDENGNGPVAVGSSSGVIPTGTGGTTATAGQGTSGVSPSPTGTGVVSQPGTTASGQSSSTPPSPSIATPSDCSEPSAAAVRLQVLSESLVNNTVFDLFEVDGELAKGLGRATDNISLELRMNLSNEVAKRAVSTLANWAPCSPTAPGGAEACELQIIDQIGSKGFRRALSETERAQFKALFDAGIAAADFNAGVEWFISGLLQAPDFIYEVIRPSATEQPGQVVPLAPYEYASRLAHFIWGGPPDDALMEAAGNGTLTTPEQRDAQIARMVDDPRFLRGVTEFYAQWLPFNGFNELARDAEGFNAEVVDALKTSLLMTVKDIYAANNPSFADLFTGDTYFLNDVLRNFYGVQGAGADFTKTAMPNEARRGLLTHPAMMALLARPKESNPISRGLYLLRAVLCVNIAPPPKGLVIPDLPPVSEGVSTRERITMHTADPVCASCHDVIDPAGFVFESFDEVGRYRTLDHGTQVDTSGTLTLNRDTDGPFTQGSDFLARLSDSPAVRACFAEHYLDFALGHSELDQADRCSQQSISDTFTGSGDLKQLLVSVANSDSFRMRLAEGVGQ
jgi:Protein of unknown function (DUF1592)/Protein of unknown function (DUF1588)/Protein of unknown function (DUF1595)/Protein of unknown function (DUF1585)